MRKRLGRSTFFRRCIYVSFETTCFFFCRSISVEPNLLAIKYHCTRIVLRRRLNLEENIEWYRGNRGMGHCLSMMQ